MKPLVSIIIPTYNRPRLLAECLHSITLDAYRYKEVIIVNDGGSDISGVIAAYSQKVRIVSLQSTVNRGHVHARNQGLTVAQGDILVLCDDDDLLLPGHIDRMVNAWKKNQNALLYSDAEIVVYDHAHGGRHLVQRTAFAFEFHQELLHTWNIIVPSGITYAHILHETVGAFDEDIRDHWDWDFALRVAAHNPIQRIPVASVLYMVSLLGQNQSSNSVAMSRSLQRLIQKHKLGELPVSSFPMMTTEPALARYRRPTRLIWDGHFPVH